MPGAQHSSQSAGPSGRRKWFVIGVAILCAAIAYSWYQTRPDQPPQILSPAANVAPSPASAPLSTTQSAPLVPNESPGVATSRSNKAEEKAQDQAEPTENGEPPPPEFVRLAEEVTVSIPSLAALRTLSAAEVHHTPEALRTAGRELGRMVKALNDNPKLYPYGIRYYERCALNETYPDTVRALCFADARNFLQKAGQSLADFAQAEQVPLRVRKLAELI